MEILKGILHIRSQTLKSQTHLTTYALTWKQHFLNNDMDLTTRQLLLLDCDEMWLEDCWASNDPMMAYCWDSYFQWDYHRGDVAFPLDKVTKLSKQNPSFLHHINT